VGTFDGNGDTGLTNGRSVETSAVGGTEAAGVAAEGTAAGLTWADGSILGLGIGVVRTAARGVTEFEADITLPLPRAAAAAKNALACALPLPLPPGLAPRPLAPAGLDIAANFGEPQVWLCDWLGPVQTWRQV